MIKLMWTKHLREEKLKKKKPQSWSPKKQIMSLQFYLGQNILGQWGLNKKKGP